MNSQILQVPSHVAIIMDGNGRWARSLNKSRTYGHRAGHTAVLKVVRHSAKIGIKSLTLYAFSSENWSRPASEVTALMELFYQAIKRNRRLFLKHNIRFSVIGDTSVFSEKLQKVICKLEEDTLHNTGMALNIAANYGGKWDITQASKIIADKVSKGLISVCDIDESLINDHMCLSNQAPVDLLIRTGGEQRISNYLLWQSAYAEFYFTQEYWPEFNEQSLDNAVEEYNLRTRRFGTVIDNG